MSKVTYSETRKETAKRPKTEIVVTTKRTSQQFMKPAVEIFVPAAWPSDTSCATANNTHRLLGDQFLCFDRFGLMNAHVYRACCCEDFSILWNPSYHHSHSYRSVIALSLLEEKRLLQKPRAQSYFEISSRLITRGSMNFAVYLHSHITRNWEIAEEQTLVETTIYS